MGKKQVKENNTVCSNLIATTVLRGGCAIDLEEEDGGGTFWVF